MPDAKPGRRFMRGSSRPKKVRHGRQHLVPRRVAHEWFVFSLIELISERVKRAWRQSDKRRVGRPAGASRGPGSCQMQDPRQSISDRAVSFTPWSAEEFVDRFEGCHRGLQGYRILLAAAPIEYLQQVYTYCCSTPRLRLRVEELLHHWSRTVVSSNDESPSRLSLRNMRRLHFAPATYYKR